MSKILLCLPLFVFSLSACAPAPEPASTPTSVGFTAPSVELVDTFYKIINNAQTKDDLFESWDMLTNEAQCNPREKCEYANFQKKWQDSKTANKLYDCGSNSVIVEETRYPRSDNSPLSSVASRFWRYQMVETENGLMIKNISGTQAPGDDCVLILE